MKKKSFQQLEKSLREGEKIRRSRLKPARVSIPSRGKVVTLKHVQKIADQEGV